jgi:hypothetical protein
VKVFRFQDDIQFAFQFDDVALAERGCDDLHVTDSLFPWAPVAKEGPYWRSLYLYFSQIAREKQHDPKALVVA